MVFLGFGKYARADRIYALEPLPGGERGSGRRTRVWVDGVAEPIVASLAGVRAAIVSGGLLSVVGTAICAIALPALIRYDARDPHAE